MATFYKWGPNLEPLSPVSGILYVPPAPSLGAAGRCAPREAVLCANKAAEGPAAIWSGHVLLLVWRFCYRSLGTGRKKKKKLSA